MALATTSKKMREEATCSICLQLMAEPVSISCGHSYCQACLLSFMGLASSLLRQWRRETFFCPQCRAPFQRGSLRPNKQLDSLIAAIRELEQEQKQELFCQEHEERLHLFCEEEGQLICLCCERGLRHKGHATSLVEDAVPVYREQLQEAVRKLRQLEEECASQKAFKVKQRAEWNEKIEAGRQKIQEAFQYLLSFLKEEEKRYLWRLESEKLHTLQRLRDREAKLGQQSRELESRILELEERCQGSAQKMLQDVKAALSRSQAVRLETPEALSLEVQTECEFRELYFDPIERLRSHQVGVTLDPETAHPELILSKDQRQVTRRDCPQGAGDPSPQRFTVLPCILGRQSFTSGWQYFEVDVGEGMGWDVGVCLESVQRLRGSLQKPEAGFWALRLCPRDGYQALTWPRTPLGLEKPPLVVGVLVDCEVGVVSFYNATSGSHLFTFPRASFPGVLRPYFQVSLYSPLFLPSPDE